MSRFNSCLGFREVFSSKDGVLRCMFAEFLGVFLLVFVGCGSCVTGWEGSDVPTLVHISLSFGFTIATVVHCTSHVSGGHVNPAVTLSMFVIGRLGLVRCCLYMASQCGGAIAGAAVLRAITPDRLRASLGQATLAPGLSTAQGFFVEFMLTFCLVLTVCAVTDQYRMDTEVLSPPLAIGLAITAVHLFGIRYTGSSINPARALGPSVMTGIWDDHWIYWIGPLLGGPFASLMYEKVFSVSPPPVSHESVLEDSTLPLQTSLRTDEIHLKSVFRPARKTSILDDTDKRGNSTDHP